MIQSRADGGAVWGVSGMQWSRRSLLASGLAAPLAASLAPAAGAALRATGHVGGRAQFDPLLGDTFLLRCTETGDAPSRPARLARIDCEVPTDGIDDGRFVLHFDMIDGTAATQSVYTVRHPALDSFAVLAVPSCSDGTSLAVVFNNPR